MRDLSMLTVEVGRVRDVLVRNACARYWLASLGDVARHDCSASLRLCGGNRVALLTVCQVGILGC